MIAFTLWNPCTKTTIIGRTIIHAKLCLHFLIQVFQHIPLVFQIKKIVAFKSFLVSPTLIILIFRHAYQELEAQSDSGTCFQFLPLSITKWRFHFDPNMYGPVSTPLHKYNIPWQLPERLPDFSQPHSMLFCYSVNWQFHPQYC